MCVYIYILTTKTPNYLVIRFSHYSFLFFTQYLILSTRAIPIDLDRIYIIPSNLLRSLFAPLHKYSLGYLILGLVSPYYNYPLSLSVEKGR